MQTPARTGHALADRAGHLRLWLTVATGVLLDLGTKYLAWRRLGAPLEPNALGRAYELIPGWIRLVTSRNPGIVFGLNIADHLPLGPIGGQAVTVLLTLVTCILILYVFVRTPAGHRWTHIWCGLVLAGALGNLYDRLLFGYVRDFIHITRCVNLFGRTFAWPYVFNLADVYLVAGIAAVALVYLFGPDERKSKPKGETARRERQHGSARP